MTTTPDTPVFPTVGMTPTTAAEDSALNFTPAIIPEADQDRIMHLLATNYARPEEAVVRELVTNAIDSHTIAGVDAPIEIHRPTAEEPFFTVTDYGIGMTPDDMVNIYANYTSGKIGNKAVSGKFGIGAKSVYAVAGRFTALAVKNGIATDMVFALQPNKAPGSAVVSVTETTASDGVRLSIPVDPEKLTTWDTAVTSVITWAPTGAITVVNSPDEQLTNFRDETYRETMIKLPKNIIVSANHECFVPADSLTVVMGPVKYDVPVNLKKRIIAQVHKTIFSNNKYSYRRLESLGIIVEMPVKSLDVVATRESIIDNAYAQELLTEYVINYLDRLREKYIVSNGPTLVDALTSYQRMPDSVREIMAMPDAAHWFVKQLIEKDPLPNRLPLQNLNNPKESPFSWEWYEEFSARMDNHGNAPMHSVHLDWFNSMLAKPRTLWIEYSVWNTEKGRDIVRNWRKSHRYKVGLVVVPDDIQGGFSNIFPDDFEWMELEDLIADTLPMSKPKPSQPRHMTLITRTINSETAGNNYKAKVLITDLREELRDNDDTVIVTGTEDEFRENPSPAVRALSKTASTKTRPVIHLLSSGRKPTTIAEILNVSADRVIDPATWRETVIKDSLHVMTDRQKNLLADLKFITGHKSIESKAFHHKITLIKEMIDEIQNTISDHTDFADNDELTTFIRRIKATLSEPFHRDDWVAMSERYNWYTYKNYNIFNGVKEEINTAISDVEPTIPDEYEVACDLLNFLNSPDQINAQFVRLLAKTLQ